MIGVKQLAIILTGAILFISGLWYFTREGKDDIGISYSEEKSTFRDMNDRIVEFGEKEYNEDQQAKIRTDITAAEMANQLDVHEVKSLNNKLNNSLKKSLNLSFNSLFSSSCFETSEFTKIIRLLEKQTPRNKEANDNIQKHYNVKKFKSLDTKMNILMRCKYSSSYKEEIDIVFSLNGVSSCKGCRTLKVKFLRDLNDLKKMDLRYEDQVNRGRYLCSAFAYESYYYQLLIDIGECPE